MAISAKWFKDSFDPASNEGYVVRDGIDSASTGYRYENLGLVYLDKNNNKKLDADDLVIGSIVDTQPGLSGQLRQDASQPGVYSIRSDQAASAASGIAVVFDPDFNSGKPVAPPAPKVVKASGTGSSSSASPASASQDSVPASIFGSTANQPSPVSGNTPVLPSSSTGVAKVFPSSSSLPQSTQNGSSSPANVSTISTLYPGIASASVTTPPTSTAVSGSFQDASGEVSRLPAAWTKVRPIKSAFIKELVSNFIPNTKATASQQVEPAGKQLDLSGFGLDSNSDLLFISRSKSTGGDVLRSNSLSTLSSSSSALLGDKGNDIIYGGNGSDLIDGSGGNDLIKAGDGDDIITGGNGADNIYGGFGKNVFLSEQDGSKDRLYITSDQYVVNPNFGNRASNNTDGSKADLITSLDSSDQIIILGVFTSQLSFYQSVATSGLSGIGIYANGTLEALYTGSELTLSQVAGMTSGQSFGYQDVVNSL